LILKIATQEVVNTWLRQGGLSQNSLAIILIECYNYKTEKMTKMIKKTKKLEHLGKVNGWNTNGFSIITIKKRRSTVLLRN